MIVKKQKPIEFINQCNCLVDYGELKKAIIWYSDKPTARLKSIYLHGNKNHSYPAVSIYEKKIHVHRLLMMYWLNRILDASEYVHHKDENTLNAFRENLQVMKAKEHPVHHLKGRKQSSEIVLRRTNASCMARYGHSISRYEESCREEIL